MKALKSPEKRSIGKQKRFSAKFKTSSRVSNAQFIGCAESGGAKMEEGVTIAKVPDWMVLTPEMMPHLIRAHDNVGRTLTEEETVTLLRSLGFEISEAK